MGTIEMGGEPEQASELIDEVVAGTGVAVVRSDDPEAFAIEFTDRLDAELLDSPEGLVDAIAALEVELTARTAALAALEVHARTQSRSAAGYHEITDVGALRRLVERIDAAEELVEASRSALTARLATGTGVAVHPDAIRTAAAEVRNERAALASLDAEIAELEDAADGGDGEPDGVAAVADASDDVVRTWDDGERRSMIRAGVAGGVSLVGAVVLIAVSSTFLGFVVPAAIVVWMVMMYRRNQEGLAGYDVASDNLAAVTALTDRAYGGAVLVRPPELLELDRRRLDVLDRLRYAESRWVGLVGTEVDAASVDEWLETREPSHRIGDAELSRTPSIRAASGQLRRLMAQWKLAWYALDRPVPSVADAGSSLDALAEEGIEGISVATYERRTTGAPGDDDRFSELADGRSIDELRAAAAITPRPLVVLDADGSMTAADLEARTEHMPADVRIVVVGPSGGGRS